MIAGRHPAIGTWSTRSYRADRARETVPDRKKENQQAASPVAAPASGTESDGASAEGVSVTASEAAWPVSVSDGASEVDASPAPASVAARNQRPSFCSYLPCFPPPVPQFGSDRGKLDHTLHVVVGTCQYFLRRLPRMVAQSLLDEAGHRTLGSPLAPAGPALPCGRRFRGFSAGCLRADALPCSRTKKIQQFRPGVGLAARLSLGFDFGNDGGQSVSGARRSSRHGLVLHPVRQKCPLLAMRHTVPYSRMSRTQVAGEIGPARQVRAPAIVRQLHRVISIPCARS